MPIVFCRYHSVFALNNHDSYSPRGAGCLLIHLRPSLPDFAGKATGIAGWLLTALLHYDVFARDILLMRIILTRTSKSFTDENGGFFPDTEAQADKGYFLLYLITPNPTLLPETYIQHFSTSRYPRALYHENTQCTI